MGGGCMPGVTGGQVRLGKRAAGVGAQCHTHCLCTRTAWVLTAWARATVGWLVMRAPVEDDGGTSTSPPISARPRVAGGKRPSVARPVSPTPSIPLPHECTI